MYSDTLTIHRFGNPAFERDVRIFDEFGCSWSIDPQREIQLATGSLIARDYAIVSMATGFVDAGYAVVIWGGRRFRGGPFRGSPIVVPIYYLYGLMWSHGNWTHIVESLTNHIRPESRLLVLEATGKYYLKRPDKAQDHPRLIVP